MNTVFRNESKAKWQETNNNNKKSPAVAVVQEFKDLLVGPACGGLDVSHEAGRCEQVDVCILG